MDIAITIIIAIFLVGWILSGQAKKDIKEKMSKPDNVKVVRVKGERQAAVEIAKYLKLGYRLENSSARKALYSPATGVFTRKQIHTLTFIKD